MLPKNLRCEYISSPLGIETRQPRLCWQLDDDRRDARQWAYRIIVSHSLADLEQERALWDSGKVGSDQSVHVVYGGPALKARRREHGKRRVGGAAPHAAPSVR